MSGMEIPLILGAGGALVGSQVDKKNPLRGALLGGAAGGLGGAALAPTAGATGVGSATAASQFGTLSTAPTAGTFGALSSAAPASAGTFGTFAGSAAGAEAATAAMMASTNQAVNAASQAVAGNVANPFKLSPAQAMAAQRMMGGFGQPEGGTSTQTGAFRPGQQVNLADPIASLLAPKRKRERAMISLL